MLQPIEINGLEANWLIDTGAARAVVSSEEAARLQLEDSGLVVKLAGIGKRTAKEALPVTIRWKERECVSQPCIVDNLVVPGLIGYQEAKKLRMVIRPENNSVDVLLIDERIPPENQIVPQPKIPEMAKSSVQTEELTQAMKGKISTDLPNECAERLWLLLLRHKHVWLQPTFGRVKTKAEFIAIGRPIKDKLRPLNSEMKKELEKQVEDLLALKVIRPSKFPWASSPVFVRKADGSWRMAIDYRRLNRKIKTDGYPIPLLWEQLQLAGGHLFYARLDGKSGFFNVPLTESSKELTAFNTHKGLYEYNVLPIGVKNSPAEFQRVMDNILGELYGKGVLCYIDDIVIYSNVFSEWLNLIDQVFTKLWDGGVFVEPKKCEFGSRVIPVLGHLLSVEGILPNPKKISAIKAAKAPENRKELMSFLGLVGFVRRFIPKYSEHTVNLTSLLRKKVSFAWTTECQREFERLKELIVEATLLSVPNDKGSYVLLCDASQYAIGSVLAQWCEKELRVLEFSSHKFSTTERNWSTREKEAYAIRWSVQRFEPYLKGMKVYVLTDHASLQWMDSATSGKVQRWALYLQQFDLHVKAISGIDNGMADWLSRSVEVRDDKADEEIEAICTPIVCAQQLPTEREEREVFKNVPYLPTYAQWREASISVPTADKDYVAKHVDGLWYSKPGNKLYVPTQLRDCVLYYFHAGPLGGHFGVGKTYRRLKRWFYWPKQKNDVAEYIRNCLPCKRTGPPNKRYLRESLSRPSPFQLISLDFVGPRNWNNKRVFYLVIIDHFSRFVVVKPTATTTTSDCIKILHEDWVMKFGAPETVLADKGKAFVSKKFQTYVCEYLTARMMYSGTGYPQGNAVNEAVHKGLEASLTARRQYDATMDYDEILADAVVAYNSTPHSNTGQSPYFLLFGKELTLPGLQRFEEQLPETQRLARLKEAQTIASIKATMRADQNLRLQKVEEVREGDRVVYYLFASERERVQIEGEEGPLIKYSSSWSEPVTVTQVSGNSIEITTAIGKKIQVTKRLIRKVGRDVPPSLQSLSIGDLEIKQPYYPESPPWGRDEKTPRKRLRAEETKEEGNELERSREQEGDV